jgi:hypothetical protein
MTAHPQPTGTRGCVPFRAPSRRKRRCRAEPPRNHDPRVGGSSPSSGIELPATRHILKQTRRAEQFSVSLASAASLGVRHHAGEPREPLRLQARVAPTNHGCRRGADIYVPPAGRRRGRSLPPRPGSETHSVPSACPDCWVCRGEALELMRTLCRHLCEADGQDALATARDRHLGIECHTLRSPRATS